MTKKLSILLFSVLAVLSCNRSSDLTRRPIELVDEILSQEEGRALSLIKGFDPSKADADICIFGEPDRVKALCDKFLSDDFRDNMTGKLRPDTLLDFSGERFSCILDSANLGYLDILASGRTERLREITVQQGLMALDTICHMSAYDKDGLSRKRTAKVIIIASPCLSTFGMFDLDTLMHQAGVSVPVMGTFDAMCDRLMRSRKGSLNVGVICPEEYAGKGVYETIFRNYASLYSRTGCSICEYECFDPSDPLKDFLDHYILSGASRPLDAVFIDDYNVEVARMNRSYARLTSVMSRESLVYGKYMADGFAIYDGESTVVQRCYRYLRDNNLFTFDIAWPIADYYYTVRRPQTAGRSSAADFMLTVDRRNVQK